jgi:hypothetical protein
MKKDFVQARSGPVNDLEILLLSSAHEPQLRYEFYRQLVRQDLLVLCSPGEASRPWAFERYGQRFVPAFSSLDRLIEFAGQGADQHYLRMDVSQILAQLGTREELYLNPESSYGRAFTRRELQALSRGDFRLEEAQHPWRIHTSHESRIRAPLGVPAKLSLALISFCLSHPVLDSAHLGEIATADAPDDFHWIVGVETHARKHWEAQDLLIELCLHMQQHAVPGSPVDFCLLEDFPPMAEAARGGFVKRIFRRALAS